MKKFLSLLLTTMLVSSFTACDNAEKENSSERGYISSSDGSSSNNDDVDIIARLLTEHPDAETETAVDGHVFISYYDGDDRILVKILPSGSVQTMNYGPDFYRENFPSYDEVQA